MDVVSWDHAVNDKYNYNAKFGVYHNESDSYNKRGSISTDPTYWMDAKIRSTRLDFNTQHNVELADWNTLSVGYNFESEFIDGSSHEDGAWPTDANYSGNTIQNDIFVHDLINIKDTLFMRGGARLLTNNEYGTYVLPNISSALVFNTLGIKGAKTKFRGSFGQSVNTPTLYQRYGIIPFMLQANPNLEAEKMTGFDAGVEQSFFDDKLSMEFGWFHNDYKNYIGYNWNPTVGAGIYENIEGARSWGFESGIRFQPNDKFKATINYTYTYARDKISRQNLPGSVYNRINGNLYWTPTDRLTFFTGAEFGDGVYYYTDNTNLQPSKTQAYVNVKLGGEVKVIKTENFDLSIQGTVYNLLNQKIALYQSNAWNNYYAPGINFMAGIFAKYSLPVKSNEKI